MFIYGVVSFSKIKAGNKYDYETIYLNNVEINVSICYKQLLRQTGY